MSLSRLKKEREMEEGRKNLEEPIFQDRALDNRASFRSGHSRRRDGCLTTESIQLMIIRHTTQGRSLDVVPMLFAEQQPDRELLLVVQRSRTF